MSEKHTCEKLIYHSPWSSPPCGKTAGYEYAGRWYCKMHHPPIVKARQDARNEALEREGRACIARREAHYRAEDARQQLAELAPRLAEALEFCTDRLASVATDGGVLREAIGSARALLGRVREIEDQNK